jgi:hypothetical protein
MHYGVSIMAGAGRASADLVHARVPLIRLRIRV